MNDERYWADRILAAFPGSFVLLPDAQSDRRSKIAKVKRLPVSVSSEKALLPGFRSSDLRIFGSSFGGPIVKLAENHSARKRLL